MLLELDLKDLARVVKKLNIVGKLQGSVWLKFTKDCVSFYYNDRNSTLVERLDIVSDYVGNHIITISDLNKAITSCLPATPLISVSSVNIDIDKQRKRITFRVVKTFKKTDNTSDVIKSEAKCSLSYRDLKERVQDSILLEGKYKKIWDNTGADIWDRNLLIDYIRKILSVNGDTIIFTTKREMFYSKNLRYVMLYPMIDCDKSYGFVISNRDAKKLVSLLSLMRSDIVKVINQVPKGKPKRLSISDLEGNEGYSFDLSEITGQDVLSVGFYHKLLSEYNHIEINRSLLQDIAYSFGEIELMYLFIDGDTLHICDKEDRSNRDYTLDLKKKSGEYVDSLVLDFISFKAMIRHLDGDNVRISYISEYDKANTNSYIKIEGNKKGTPVFYCVDRYRR